MVAALARPGLTLAFVLAFVFLKQAEVVVAFLPVAAADGKCRSEQIECMTGGKCIYKYQVCDETVNCPDGSDEVRTICKFWPPKHQNCRQYVGERFYYAGSCRHVYTMCSNAGWSNDLNPRICEVVRLPKLQPPQDAMDMSNEIVALLSLAVNSSQAKRKPDCPMLYSRVGKECLSFFSPAKVLWPEARHFCRSIYGELWQFTDIATYGALLAYIREEQFTSDYWIGGRFDLDTNAWSWTTDDSVMPLGAPYWAMQHAATCVRRGSPHTDPYSDPPTPPTGGRCFLTELSPRERTAGWCAAMTFENYYYWSDELCDEAFSPLCVYTEPTAAQLDDTA